MHILFVVSLHSREIQTLQSVEIANQEIAAISCDVDLLILIMNSTEQFVGSSLIGAFQSGLSDADAFYRIQIVDLHGVQLTNG